MSPSRWLSLVLVVAAPWAVGCSSNPSNGSGGIGGYVTECSVDADCVGVPAEPCAACACPTTAINASDKDKYLADFDRLRSACTSKPACDYMCTTPQVACLAGRCAIVTPESDAGTGAD